MRTQIALSHEQHARVKQKAAALGITMAEYMRRLVDSDLGSTDTLADPTSIIGIGRSGGSDIAREGKDAVATAIDEYASKR
jgi:hypothetical protein